MPDRPPPANARARRRAFAAAVVSLAALNACNDDGRTLREPEPAQNRSISTTTSTVASTDLPAPDIIPGAPVETMNASSPPPDLAPMSVVAPWRDGGPIDPRHTCDGADVSPALSWFSVPLDAEELAVAVTDDQADGFVHWVVAGLAPIDGALPEGDVPDALVEAANDFSTTGAPVIGWKGPCPPPGSGPHTYRFTVFALNPGIELPDGTPAVDMLTAIRTASVASAVVTGTYER